MGTSGKLVVLYGARVERPGRSSIRYFLAGRFSTHKQLLILLLFRDASAITCGLTAPESPSVD